MEVVRNIQKRIETSVCPKSDEEIENIYLALVYRQAFWQNGYVDSINEKNLQFYQDMTERAFQITGTCYFYINTFESCDTVFFHACSLYCVNALASWSGQDVGLNPHLMPDILFIASSISMPSISAATPCVLPEQPPSKCTLVILLSTTSKSIEREHTPDVLYFIL